MQTPKKGIINEIALHPTAFALVFLLSFVVLFAFLAAADMLPEPIAAPTETPVAVESTQAVAGQTELPIRIVAKTIGMDATIANPTSTDVDILDTALLRGAARYPTSAKLGEEGTMLLFGHSSYLPIVHNQAYKTFDGIQDLREGEIVSVYSGSTEYRYKVVGVRVADANEDMIELVQTGKHLTLVTCDSFSKKTNRFVVTADFVGSYTLAQ